MIQFKIKPTIVTIYGAQVQIKAITPATKDDVIEVYSAFTGDLDVEKLLEATNAGVIARTIIGLTNITEEELNATPYFVQTEILAHIFKENLGLFPTAMAAMGTILNQTTPQSSKS